MTESEYDELKDKLQTIDKKLNLLWSGDHEWYNNTGIEDVYDQFRVAIDYLYNGNIDAAKTALMNLSACAKDVAAFLER